MELVYLEYFVTRYYIMVDNHVHTSLQGAPPDGMKFPLLLAPVFVLSPSFTRIMDDFVLYEPYFRVVDLYLKITNGTLEGIFVCLLGAKYVGVMDHLIDEFGVGIRNVGDG